MPITYRECSKFLDKFDAQHHCNRIVMQAGLMLCTRNRHTAMHGNTLNGVEIETHMNRSPGHVECMNRKFTPANAKNASRETTASLILSGKLRFDRSCRVY